MNKLNNTSITPRTWNKLVAAARQAEASNNGRKEAYAALRDAFQSAEWGQNGSTFITNRSNWPSSGGHTRTLYVQGRRVATCDDRGWVVIIDPTQAETEYQATRRRARGYGLVYKAERERLISALVANEHCEAASFADWTFWDGQKGGFFQREDSNIRVAAESALKAAEKIRPFFSSNKITMTQFGVMDHEEEWDRALYGARY